MLTTRKPHPIHLTREDVEAMIAAASESQRAHEVARTPLAIRTSPTLCRK